MAKNPITMRLIYGPRADKGLCANPASQPTLTPLLWLILPCSSIVFFFSSFWNHGKIAFLDCMFTFLPSVFMSLQSLALDRHNSISTLPLPPGNHAGFLARLQYWWIFQSKISDTISISYNNIVFLVSLALFFSWILILLFSCVGFILEQNKKKRMS